MSVLKSLKYLDIANAVPIFAISEGWILKPLTIYQDVAELMVSPKKNNPISNNKLIKYIKYDSCWKNCVRINKIKEPKTRLTINIIMCFPVRLSRTKTLFKLLSNVEE